MASNGGYHIRVLDMSDREVIGLLQRHLDDDGLADAKMLAEGYWPGLANGNGSKPDDDKLKAIRGFAVRLAYMRRIGLVTRHVPAKGERRSHYTRWSPTSEGLALYRGKLTVPQERALGGLDGTKLVLAMHRLAEQPRDELHLKLMRRAAVTGGIVRA